MLSAEFVWIILCSGCVNSSGDAGSSRISLGDLSFCFAVAVSLIVFGIDISECANKLGVKHPIMQIDVVEHMSQQVFQSLILNILVDSCVCHIEY